MLKINRIWRVAGVVGLLAAVVVCAEESPAPLSLPKGPTLLFLPETNHYEAKPGEENATVTIRATNVWTNSIVIQQVATSCHCTVADMPETPWILAPGQGGEISAHVELNWEEGVETKYLTFFTSVGERVVTLEIVIPPPPPGQPQTDEERAAARLAATADPKAIFHGDCAVCHVDKARALTGKDLYVAACGICHESPRRASIVPDLRTLKQAPKPGYWKDITINGKPHTLMPGFAQAQGGPLTDGEVDSLATYLEASMAHPPPAGKK